MWVATLLAAMTVSAPSLSTELPRGIGTWDPTTLGNHRIVISVPTAASAIKVHIPWRRRDRHPEHIDTVVTDAAGHRVLRVYRREINREFGDIAFEPTAGTGTYYLYHLPHVTHGSYYPSVVYTPPVETADKGWEQKAASGWDSLPEAIAEKFESVSELDAYSPMEVIATHSEVAGILAQHPLASYLVFPEDRHLSIRMWDDLPARWAQRGANTPFEGSAKRGEYYAFQLGVWAAKQSLDSVQVSVSNLTSGKSVITSKAFTCFNTDGVDYKGKPFQIQLNVQVGKVQPLWCGFDIPVDTKPGVYSGTATITGRGLVETQIPLSLTITNQIAKDHGDDHPEDMTRLRWLNSRLGQDHEIVQPFSAEGPLASKTELSEGGFFAQVSRNFTTRMDGQSSRGAKLLAQPMRLTVETTEGTPTEKVEAKPKKKRTGADGVTWSQKSTLGPLIKSLTGSLQFDGTAEFQVQLTASEDCSLKDIRLELPLRRDVAKYFMGLGRTGGTAPEALDWKWNVENNQEGAWVGAVNCGLLFALRDERYVRPLNTNFYHEKPLILPSSWCNSGSGGIRIQTEGEVYRVTCYSGPRTMKKGEILHFTVHMMLTPSKPIQPARQFSERYYHSFKPLSEIQRDGANVVNVHHATEINPWINYPFLGFDNGPSAKMKAYITDAHKRGMKVKIYDTIRELTNRAPELFMLKSLGNEVFSEGKGGGGSWLREHLDDNYISAWHATEVGDAAIIDSGMSRWHNYYVEGLDWLARNVGIDGLYLDDVAFDRTTMLRVRKVLARRIAERGEGGSPVLDLHSANQHNPNDGWNNSALLYADLMPFLDRLWFGEYFDYTKSPDYWLVEISGIPYGLMGEMLQDGGNPWRGMLFGMTARRPWSGDPRPLWKAWDEFGIKESEMIGWWADCPVTTSDKDVLATVYKRAGSALIALASWAPEATSVKLKINWRALGIDPKKAKIEAKAIDKFQTRATFKVGEPITVEPGKGWLLTVSQQAKSKSLFSSRADFSGT